MSEQRILLPLLGGIDGPLVDDDVVVKGGDGRRPAASRCRSVQAGWW